MLARGFGICEAMIYDITNHRLSTFRLQVDIVTDVHSVLLRTTDVVVTSASLVRIEWTTS